MDESLNNTSGTSMTPSALLQLFNNALSPTPLKTMLLVKGIYKPGKGANYNGYYYDSLKDEATETSLTLIVPALLRGKLAADKTIEFHAFMTKRVVPVGGRIELHLNITDLVAQTQNRYSDKEVRALAIQQEKVARGYRDAEAFIKARIVQEQKVTVTILVGKTAIIDSDIKHALGEGVGFYDVRFERISLSSESEILGALEQYNDSGLTDLLVLSRGGGENMEIFDNPAIAEYCLGLEPIFLTAIGHKENVSLLQRIADKAFITPTALGQWLRVLYNDTVAELENSKAKLVETISTQLKTNYEQQVQNLQGQIKGLEELGGKDRELRERELAGLKEQLRSLQAQQEEKETMLVRTRELADGYQAQVRRLAAAAGTGRVVRWVGTIAVTVAAGVIGWWLGRR